MYGASHAKPGPGRRPTGTPRLFCLPRRWRPSTRAQLLLNARSFEIGIKRICAQLRAVTDWRIFYISRDNARVRLLKCFAGLSERLSRAGCLNRRSAEERERCGDEVSSRANREHPTKLPPRGDFWSAHRGTAEYDRFGQQEMQGVRVSRFARFARLASVSKRALIVFVATMGTTLATSAATAQSASSQTSNLATLDAPPTRHRSARGRAPRGPSRP